MKSTDSILVSAMGNVDHRASKGWAAKAHRAAIWLIRRALRSDHFGISVIYLVVVMCSRGLSGSNPGQFGACGRGLNDRGRDVPLIASPPPFSTPPHINRNFSTQTFNFHSCRRPVGLMWRICGGWMRNMPN